MSRMIRFKMKYKFWGCVDPMTQALTRTGWKFHSDLKVGDEILTLNPWTDNIEWQPIRELSVFDYQGDMHRWTGKVDALTTPNHRWLAEVPHGRGGTYRREREIVFSGLRPQKARLITGGGTPMEFADAPKWDDELVETVGWYVTEGCDHYNQNGFHTILISQLKDSRFTSRLRYLMHYWRQQGATCNEWPPTTRGMVDFYYGKGVNQALEDVAPGKQLTPEFLCSLTYRQAKLLYETLLDGDGCRTRGQERWTQTDQGRVDGFQMLSAMLGMRGRYFQQKVTNYATRFTSGENIPDEVITYSGKVWCPTVDNSIWFARRGGTTYWTGNTAAEGTRQVFCVDDETEILTRRGWLRHDQIQDDDETLGIDPVTKVSTWQPILSIHRFDYNGDLVHWQNSHGFDALTTPNHRWLTAHRDRNGNSDWYAPARFMETHVLSGGNKQIITGGSFPQCFASEKTFSDELVELIGWAVTEGHYQKPPARTAVIIAQSETANPEKVENIRRLVKHFAGQGASAREMNTHRQGIYVGSRDFYFGAGIGNVIRQLAPGKRLLPEFLTLLTLDQADLLLATLIAGDGHLASTARADRYARTVETKTFVQNRGPLVADVQMLASMMGIRTAVHDHSINPKQVRVTFYARTMTTARHLKDERVAYKGIVWCPRTKTGTWLARRNGGTYWTGNTYTELWAEDAYQSFVNDELLESNENPLGVIPVVQIANTKVPSSPWGLSDIQDITDLNRQYNETATLITDIIDYYGSPTTVIIGARANNLERGPKKVWAVPNEKAKIENLELNANLDGPLNFLEQLKGLMHQLVGIPINALGDELNISNTSGVALSLQFLPLMNKIYQKNTQYRAGLQRLNALIIRVASIYEPLMMGIDPTRDPELEDGQYSMLDPMDPVTYLNTVEYASPLPIDILIALNEIQMKMMLGLESKEGALRILGEPYPAEKLQELIEELHQDALEQGALDLLNAQIKMFIMTATGMGIDPQTGQIAPPEGGPAGSPGSGGQQVNSAGGPNVNSAGQSGGVTTAPPFIAQQGVKEIYQELNTLAAGTKIPQVRNPAKEKD